LEKEWNTISGRTIGVYKEAIVLRHALWVVAVVLGSKMTTTKIMDHH
jgi:hypothetical protein